MTHTSTSPNAQITASLDAGLKCIKPEALAAKRSKAAWKCSPRLPGASPLATRCRDGLPPCPNLRCDSGTACPRFHSC